LHRFPFILIYALPPEVLYVLAGRMIGAGQAIGGREGDR
jgi:hypothetical protein